MAKLLLELVPGKGALPLMLGSDRRGISRAMRGLGYEMSAQRHNVDYYLHNSVQIEFDEDGLASFIGVAPNSEIDVVYRGRRILHLPSIDVFKLISEYEPGPPIKYNAAEHLFRDQVITLWEADDQYNCSGARVPVWGQIGIGNENYLAAIDKLAE